MHNMKIDNQDNERKGGLWQGLGRIKTLATLNSGLAKSLLLLTFVQCTSENHL